MSSTTTTTPLTTQSTFTLASPPTHPPAYDQNLILQISLSRISYPSITRLLSIPSSSTFSDLHRLLCAAFSYSELHPYVFELYATSLYSATRSIAHPSNTAASASRLISELPGSHNSSSSRKVLKLVKGGLERDLDQVYYGSLSQGNPLAGAWPSKDSETIRLWEVFGKKEVEGGEVALEYTYSTTRYSWIHVIDVLGSEWVPRGEKKARVLGGEGHAVAEELGNVNEWFGLRDLYMKEGLAEDSAVLFGWYENVCVNGDEDGLEGEKVWRWDRKEAERRVGEVEWGKERKVLKEGW